MQDCSLSAGVIALHLAKQTLHDYWSPALLNKQLNQPCLLASAHIAAGVIALDLAKELLELHPNSYALVVSHENITNNYYGGKDKSMLICNVSAARDAARMRMLLELLVLVF
jgi:hypothetical protein